MSLKIVILLASVAGLVGIALGYYLRLVISLGKRGSMELEIKKMEVEAQEKAKKIVLEAEQKAAETLKQLREEAREKEDKIKAQEERLIKKEDALEKKQADLDSEVESIKMKVTEIKSIKERADKLLNDRETALEKAARLSSEEAKAELIRSIEGKYGDDLVVRMQKLEMSNQEKIESRAKEILATAIHRLGNAVTSDVFSTTITIPNDEIKGKIIGKEGRNIKSFERMTGVEVIVDDTPGTITLSSQSPSRPHGARGSDRRRTHPAGKDRKAR
jgi:ribonucrease Y